jgi:hypothetical protein
MEYHQFKKDLGSKGLGRVVKATIDGTFPSVVGLNGTSSD